MSAPNYPDAITRELARLGCSSADLPSGMLELMGPAYLYGYLSQVLDGMSAEEFRQDARSHFQAERAVRGITVEE